MKTILSILVLALAAITSTARSLVVTATDGTKAYFPVTATERPVAQFADGVMTVGGKTYAFAGVKDFRLTDDDPTAIAHIPAFEQREGCLVVATSGPVAIATTDGKAVGATVTRGDGITAISVAELPRGVYVVKAGNASFKFIKR